MPDWHAELAFVGGRFQRDVRISTRGESITAVEVGAPTAGAEPLRGLVLPGLVNAHSHAFQRALRTRTESTPGTFWNWRDAMYALAERLDPDSLLRLCRAVFCEMVAAGITTVGEFHYLHHPAGMDEAVLAAAAEAGIRITLLDACYLAAGIDGAPLQGAQRRFGDGTAERWAGRVDSLRPAAARQRIGAAVHSVRAVPPAELHVVAGWAARHGAPLHAHVSEQQRENEECRRATGLSPAALLAREGLLAERFTAVHCTHPEPGDHELLGGAGAGVCVCPTTERDLADGITPARALEEAGCRLSLGSDSNAAVDLFEESRALEMDERLASGRRAIHAPERLLELAVGAGAILGWDVGRLEPGRCADFIAVDLGSRRTAGADPAGIVFAAAADDVTDVVVGGEVLVRNRRHLRHPDWPLEMAREIRALCGS